MNLADIQVGQVVTVEHVGGETAFRRRLMELGLVPGTRVELVGVAPLGDPLEFLVRGCSLSIRRSEAREVAIVKGEINVVPSRAASSAASEAVATDRLGRARVARSVQ
jgi:ferrous iron transport protein A